jgi:Protein of unknown function (DUF5818)
MKNTVLLAAALSAFSSYALAQQTIQQINPTFPADVLGPELIAWSELQKPQPMPQPLPPPERADQSQPAQSQPAQSQAQQPQEAADQPFTGTIAKDGDKYVLKISDSASYQIDDQEKAKPYEGKRVKVVGSLDAKANILHVTSIELLT